MSFSRPDPAAVPPALLSPEPTGDRLVRRANELLRRRRARRGDAPPAPSVIPGLDVAKLDAKYNRDPANTKQTVAGVFRAPIGSTWDQYAAIRRASLDRFLRVLEAKGYRLIPRKGALRVLPGTYPARHPVTNASMPEYREFRVEVDCSAPNAERVVVELDPADLAPIVRAPRRV